MRRILIVITLILFSSGLSAQTQLSEMYHEAEIPSELITAPENPVLLIFTASWCAPCQKMRNDIFPQEEVAQMLKKYNMLFLDVDTKLGFDLSKKYCRQSVVPYYVILDKDKNVIAQQIGASDAHTFCNFLSKGLPQEAKIQDATSQETLELISNESYSVITKNIMGEFSPHWNIYGELGANVSAKLGIGAGIIARHSNAHSEFETGLTLTINDFKYIGIPLDFNITIFNGGKFGIGIAPQYRLAAGELSNFDVMGRLNAGFDISHITIKVGYNYGFVNQNKGDLLTRLHNAYFTVGLAYKLF